MEDYSKLTVPQLKEKLKEKGLPVSGNKATLVDRLSGGKADTKKRKAQPKESKAPKKKVSANILAVLTTE
jgi:hypothetical protein